MKLAVVMLMLCVATSCHHDEEAGPVHFPPCLQPQVDAFESDTASAAIVRIDQPGDTLYWFQDTLSDNFELVIGSDCGFTCVTGSHFISEHNCDDAIFDYPLVIVWEK